jgi:hypothetical protein
MDHLTHPGAHVYLLPEESFYSLQELRNLIFLMASMIFVSTMEEERVPLKMPRSMLAQCFQIFATQLTDALDTSQKMVQMDPAAQRTH